MNRGLSRFFLLLILGSMLVSFLKINIVKATVNNSFAWTTLQANEGRTGYTESPSPDSNQTFWKFQTGGAIASSPAAAAGMVSVGSTDGYVYAINATSGAKIWDFWIGDGINSPTVAHGKVFITCTSGTVYALDMHTGLQVWNYTLGEEAGFGAPLIVGSRLFVNGHRNVFALNEAFGVKLYNESISRAKGIAPLAYYNGLIISVARRGTEIGVDGFEAASGYGRFWVTLAPSDIEKVTSGATVGDEKFFVVTAAHDGNSVVFALNSMAMIVWKLYIDGVTEVSPAVAYNTVYVPTSNFTYALDTDNGTVKWRHPIDGECSVSSPAVADGKVYFGLSDSRIYALDAFTGDLVWSYRTEGSILSSPAISDGLLFVGSSDENLYAIGYPLIQVFNAGTWNGKTYYVFTLSNSTVTDFVFSQSFNQVSFNVNGPSGTTGFCNITIPKDLLAGSYSVFADESQPLVFDEQSNDSHSFLYFNYDHSINIIRIEGTKVIPEFPSWMPMPLLIAVFAVAIAIYERRPQHSCKKKSNRNT